MTTGRVNSPRQFVHFLGQIAKKVVGRQRLSICRRTGRTWEAVVICRQAESSQHLVRRHNRFGFDTSSKSWSRSRSIRRDLFRHRALRQIQRRIASFRSHSGCTGSANVQVPRRPKRFVLLESCSTRAARCSAAVGSVGISGPVSASFRGRRFRRNFELRQLGVFFRLSRRRFLHRHRLLQNEVARSASSDAGSACAIGGP